MAYQIAYYCLGDFAGPKYVVPVESGLGKEKGLEILSLFVNMKKADLPEQAHSIIQECKGIIIYFVYEGVNRDINLPFCKIS